MLARFGLRRVPSGRTVGRILERVDAEVVDAVLCAWIRAREAAGVDDGDRWVQIHVLVASWHDTSVAGQTEVTGGDEISALPRLAGRLAAAGYYGRG